MRRLLLILTLALSGAAMAQSFSGGFRATMDGLALEGTVEVATYDLLDFRLSPIVTVTARLAGWEELEASALAGMAVTWLPEDSVWAVQAQVHYRVAWATPGARAGPELLISVTGEL